MISTIQFQLISYTVMTKTVRYNRWEIIVHIFVTRDFFHFILLSFPVYQHISDTLR